MRTAPIAFVLATVVILGASLDLTGCGSSNQEGLCTPGAFSFCRCQNRDKGTKQCNHLGNGFGACLKSGNTPCVGGESDETANQSVPPEVSNDVPGTGTSTEPARNPVCGDGEVEGEEACDDGNQKGGDGCSPDCRSVPGLPLGDSCPGQPVSVGAWDVSVQGRLGSGGSNPFDNPFGKECRALGFTGAVLSPSKLVAIKVRATKNGRLVVHSSATTFLPFLAAGTACGSPSDLIACSVGMNGLGVKVSAGMNVFLVVGASSQPPTNSDAFKLTLKIEP